ncbi:hypothetical protein ACTOB_004754 [Actinoplanes oblitus]|uniref:ABC transmembrane type-1 domain-containing protein n=1 Tax=Actinoplanes oblitus TaxID=3040509 RepID=A0ABY8W5L9_9ACTN|nr:hypothetical protein [Actinoplanes oblitus]WIM92797.1 hypothetical protein ACTOB_004754 [Actinoplanes oblitus]
MLVEFASIREFRAFAYAIVEKRIQFIIALQAAETAFIGVLVTQHTDKRVVALVSLVLGLPTLLLTYLTYLRALDFQIQGRRYIRAMNAIRGYFVSNDPKISSAVLLPTDPRFPRFDQIGYGGSTMQSLATKVLVLVIFLFSLLSFAAMWLIMSFTIEATGAPVVAAMVSASLCLIVSLLERNRTKRHLRRAEEESAT